MKSQWTITKQLGVFVTGLVTLFTFVALFEMWEAKRLDSLLKEVSETHLVAVKNMGLLDMMHDGMNAVVMQALYEGTANPTGLNRDQILADQKEVATNMKEYLAKITSLDLPAETALAIEAAKPDVNAYIASSEALVGKVAAGRLKDAEADLSNFSERFEALVISLGNLGDRIEKDAEAATAKGAAVSTETALFGALAIVIGIVFSVLISVYIIRKLSISLNGVFNKIVDESQTLKKSSSEIDSAAGELSDAVAKQASSLEETASSMEEVTAMLANTAKNSEQSRSLTQSTVDEATAGEALAGDLSTAMKDLENTTSTLQQIVDYINSISEKTQAINDIVFQTRILSFNASIEAERAGEHGRGFSVVAEEVGKLASMSGQASAQIRAIIDEATKKVTETVTQTQDRILKGRSVTEKFAKTFAGISTRLREIDTSVKNIAEATADQQAGVSQINIALAQIDSATQSTAQNASQLAASANNLLEGSARLEGVVAEGQSLISKNESAVTSEKIKVGSKKPTPKKAFSIVKKKSVSKPGNFESDNNRNAA